MPKTPSITKPRRRDLTLLGLAVLVAVGLVVLLVVRQGGSDPEASPAPTSATSAPSVAATPMAAPIGPLGDLARRQADDPMALGSPTAPVVLIEFADFRCPFCAQFGRDTKPVLIDRYVDKGVLRIEWRDMPIFGPESMSAARAARAAAAQGRFWEFVTAVYDKAPARGRATLTTEALRGFAETAGVPDLSRFDVDAASLAFDDAINADLQVAQALGIPSTPAFSLNGEPVLGAQPTDVFTAMIDNLAAGAPANS